MPQIESEWLHPLHVEIPRDDTYREPDELELGAFFNQYPGQHHLWLRIGLLGSVGLDSVMLEPYALTGTKEMPRLHAIAYRLHQPQAGADSWNNPAMSSWPEPVLVIGDCLQAGRHIEYVRGSRKTYEVYAIGVSSCVLSVRPSMAERRSDLANVANDLIRQQNPVYKVGDKVVRDVNVGKYF